MKFNFVYHGSQQKGLKLLKPNISTHQKPYVYATPDKAIATLFLLNYGGDFTCQIGHIDKQLYVVERYNGALNERYENKTGTIYTCDGAHFYQDDRMWCGEVVSKHEVPVIKEERINNVLKQVLLHEQLGELKLYRYPDRPAHIPHDNSDLIPKIIALYKVEGEKIFEYLEHFHPNLIPIVKSKIEKP